MPAGGAGVPGCVCAEKCQKSVTYYLNSHYNSLGGNFASVSRES